MPTKNSRVRGVRLLDKDYDLIMLRANRRGWTFNRWMNWAISIGLRKHIKSSSEPPKPKIRQVGS